jgi:hypothetical protein
VRTAPILFSPADPHVLLFGLEVLFKTVNGGRSWTIISPDLSRKDSSVPESLGIFAGEAAKSEHRGVIYAIGPSPLDVNLIWTGSDDGAVHVTRDAGAQWTDVTPKELTAWSKVTQIDASHFDRQTAYMSASRFRVDDLTPLVFRTHDGGKTWTRITNGMAENASANVVREDPYVRGLLYAGTERDVYVSFDDGDNWQPLTLNLPRSSVRDLIVKGDDLAIATHGRGFWILDNVTPLREIGRSARAFALQPSSRDPRGATASAQGGDPRSAKALAERAFLYKPQAAYRLRRNNNTDTPLPPEFPAGTNPPAGAMIDYFLAEDMTAPVTLEILTSAGKLVRKFASDDMPEQLDEKQFNVPMYWARRAPMLSPRKGMHRFVWDLRYQTPGAIDRDFPISAVVGDTPREPLGVIALPGRYTVRLTVNDQKFSHPLTVRMDPRATITPLGLSEQFALATRIATMLDQSFDAYSRIPGTTDGPTTESKRKADLAALNADLATAYDVVEGSDRAPTSQARQAVGDLERRLRKLLP